MLDKLDIPMSGSNNVSSDVLLQLFLCASGKLIWEIYQCDGKEHCDDGSDEINCKYVGTRQLNIDH